MIGLVAWTLLYLLEKYQLRITVFLERAKNTKLRDLKTLWNMEDKGIIIYDINRNSRLLELGCVERHDTLSAVV